MTGKKRNDGKIRILGIEKKHVSIFAQKAPLLFLSINKSEAKICY